MVMNVRLAINSYINLPYSVPCFLNERFIHSTMLYCLPAFHVIHEKETFISNKLFKKTYVIILTFQMRVLKCTITFEMLFIPS